jgi:hypothetical protein
VAEVLVQPASAVGEATDEATKTAERWLERLTLRLSQRAPSIRTHLNYYEGAHNLAFASEKFRQAFGGQLKEFSDNWCGVVVQAPAERLRPKGILFPNDDEAPQVADKDAWAFWQRNELDAWAAVHHTNTLATAYGYVLVWPGERAPLITVEDSEQCIVAYEPGSHTRRAAGLKCWIDEWDEHQIAYVYLPDAIYKFRSEKPVKGGGKIRFVPWSPDDEPWPLANPLGVVPLVEFRNDPTLKGNLGRSEISRVMPLQNAGNMLFMNMMVAAEFSAFRQKYVLGWTPEINPESGEPSEAQIKAAVSRLMTFESKDVEVGEFSETNLKNYVEAIEMAVHHIAAQSRTPRHYFFQTGQSPSGDAIKSAETGLVAKVKERALHFGERWEEVFRLGFAAMGDKRQNVHDAQLLWEDPEYRTEGERTDAVIKKFQAGLITWRQALDDAGYTPQQIARMESERAREVLLQQGADLGTLLRNREE